MLVLTWVCIAANNNLPSGFVLCLWDNDEVIITDNDIVSYDQLTNTIMLNEQGVKKWQNYFPASKSLANKKLYDKKFFILLDGDKILTGRFLSRYSFKSISETIINVELFAANSFKIDNLEDNIQYNENKFKLFEFFKKEGKLLGGKLTK